MVEAQLEDRVVRASTPTPGHFSQLVRQKEPKFDSPGTYRNNPEIHDRANLPTPTINSEAPDFSGGQKNTAPDSMHGDRPDQAKVGSHRRRSRSTLANPQQRPGPHPSQPTSNHSYASPLSSSDNIHSRPPVSFQGSSLHYSSPTVPYNQRGGFVGQYTMSAQPSPMNIAHSPPPFAFSHTYHHPGVPDNSMISPNIHANYQPMLQPHAPVFPYQQNSPEGASHQSFSGTHSSSIYSPHQVNTSSSPGPSHIPSPSGQSNTLSPSYVGSSAFHSLQYPSPIPTPSYPYPPQTFPPSPMYQSQYAPPPFGPHYTPTGESEPQGTWYYLPHPAPAPSPQQYDAGHSFHGHYTVGYSQAGHTMEGSYGATSPSSSANPSGSSSNYPVASAQSFSQYSDDQSPLDAPHAPGTGPPSHQSLGPAVTAAPSPSSGSGRPLMRRSYHPNPPAHRSEWVMWSGNVPSDATHDELWRFFAQQPQQTDDEGNSSGVLSIFLISRSNCAFINYESEDQLLRAIVRFNGIPLRPNDSRCPRLVCRVRRKDDDLKAGVGGQRGMGMHTKWVQEQKGKAREAASDPSELSASDDPSTSSGSISANLDRAISNVSMSSDESSKRSSNVKHSSSSGSYSSTNSSFLGRHFPKRYFILKSLTQEDLDISVQRGVWATQKHNEEILDKAFRTSKEVHLIFGVNKSGEFYGYARMTGPVRRGEPSVSWAARPSASNSRSSSSPLSAQIAPFFSPSDHRLVDNSPLPVGAPTPDPRSRKTPSPSRLRHTAPALLGEGYQLPSLETPPVKHSLDQRRYALEPQRAEGFALDASAPARAMRANQGQPGSSPGSEGQGMSGSRAAPSLHIVEEEEEKVEDPEHEVEPGEAGRERPVEEVQRGEETWGDSFAVQWLCTDPLPFHRTRHLRNPWNHDKEVKVSRDGTELEPTVGQQLLSEWEKLSEPQGPPSTGPSRPGGAGKREKEGHHDHDKTHDSGSSHHQEKILTPLQNHQRA